jgi:uncharacterized membrane protein YhaH (DUF805 family)
MSFGQAVRAVLGQYATFSGRARRSEYWYWALFTFILLAVAGGLDNVLKTNLSGQQFGWFYIVAALAIVIPTIAVTVRRLHDTDRSGWWYLLTIVCFIGPIIVFVFCVIDSTAGTNKYGDSPK